MTLMWRYTVAVIIIWVINPEIRRLYGWQFGHSTIDFLSVIPLLALIPHCWSLTMRGRWRRIPRLLMLPAFIWISSFVYALVIAFISGNVLPGLYTFAKFILPLGLGLWIASDEVPFATAYQRTTRTLFGLGTALSVYGVFQFVTAPPWDALWVHNLLAQGTAESFGRPFPFQIRVFSTLNSPGPFGNFMALILILALAQLSLRRLALLAQIPLWLIAFGLSLVRSGWLMFVGAAVVYFVFTPRRAALLATTALAIPIVAVLFVVVPAAVGNDSMLTGLSERFDSLSNLDTDTSGRARQQLYEGAGDLLAPAPLGLGLGVVGTSTQLGDTGTNTDLDSGILARFLEMGIPGITLFIVALALLFRAVLSTWRDAGLVHDSDIRSVAATAIAIEAGLVGLLFLGDFDGLLVLMLWLVMSLAVRDHLRGRVETLTVALHGRPNAAVQIG